MEITPALGYRYLTENFALSTMDPTNDSGPAACLGGIYNGVYNIEITAAYASIANGGVYTEPIVYTHIYDHDGNLLYERIPETHVAMKETTAALITDAMQDVITQGTGASARLSGMPAAGKTGTSQKSRDLWLCAYTPYLTGGVWTGFDDDQPMENFRDQSFHNRLWRDIMNRINKTKGFEYKSFKLPSSIGGTTVCADTGKLPSTEFCTPVYEYFAPGTYPSQTCPGHPDKEEEARLEEEKKKQEEEEQKRQEELENGLLNPPTPEVPSTPPATNSPLSNLIPLH
jgi:penicillin-binding protein 1A